MWNIFFLTSAIYYLFFCFFIIFDIFFSISSIWKFLNSGNFYVLLFNGLEILSKIFGKSWNVFKKILTFEIQYYSQIPLFTICFFLLAFFTSFFPISPNQTSQKILNIFVVLCYTDYWFYQRILKNSWLRKIEIL